MIMKEKTIKENTNNKFFKATASAILDFNQTAILNRDFWIVSLNKKLVKDFILDEEVVESYINGTIKIPAIFYAHGHCYIVDSNGEFSKKIILSEHEKQFVLKEVNNEMKYWEEKERSFMNDIQRRTSKDKQ